MTVRPINLDYTLGCGQVFRWKKLGRSWIGVIGSEIVRLEQVGDTYTANGNVTEGKLDKYFRHDDRIETIYADIAKDNYISKLVSDYSGLRLIRQDPWECSASFILATYANIPRIEKMIENLCRMCGRRIAEGYYTFPTPEEIIRNDGNVRMCGLGFRYQRLLAFAERVISNELNFDELREIEYEKCVRKLMRFEGIGNKVADCIALFSLDHLEAFPIDVRIARAVKKNYGIEGSYRKISKFCRKYFGEYAGYAQEFIYISEARSRGEGIIPSEDTRISVP